jgi:GNAT superfamily N-acetyltransferase
MLDLALADSLLDDPFYLAITVDFAGDPEQRRQRLGEYMAHSREEAQKVGRVDVQGREGAALWITRSDREAQEVKLLALSQVLGPKGWQNYLAMVAAMERLLAGRMDETAWYLSILGVAPARQGQGLGRQLLRPGLQAADQHSKVCYLETFGERSLPFYQRLGFEVAHRFVEPLTGEPYWVLLRDPLLKGAQSGGGGRSSG